jgi:archaellum component FlaC
VAGRQLILDLLARDKTGPATSGAARNLEHVGEAADGAAKNTEHLGKEADRAEDKVQRYGKSSRTAAEHVEHLDREIKMCERELQKLAVAFAEAKTAADRADLSKGMRQTNAELNKLKKNQNVLKDLIPDESETKNFGDKISNVISGALEAVPFGPALAGGLAGAAPLIGATISAAVIGAAGVGGVIGGVMLAARDPRVKAAGAVLGKNLLGQLQSDADVFVGPVLASIGKIESAFAAMNGKISHIFQVSSGFLGPLVDGVLGAVDGILGGIDSLVSKGKPVIDALGGSFNQIGHAIGDALTTISGDSEDAAKGLTDLTNAVSGLIETTGYVVRGLTELYGVLDKVGANPFTGWPMELAKGLGLVGSKSEVAAATQKALASTTLSAGEAAGKAGQQMQTYADAMDEAASKGRSLYDSQTDVAQAVADTEKAVKQNGHTLDINTQKGRDNRKMLSELAGKLVATYDAYVKVNGEGGAAAGIAERNRAQFIKLARQFGLTAKQASDLATQMGLLPANKKTNFYANTHDASARIAALKDQIASVHGKTVNVTVIANTSRLNKVQNQLDRLEHRAGGGSVMAGQAYLVGERQPEVFVPKVNGTIIPSLSHFERGGLPSSTGNVTVTIDLRGTETVLGQAMLKALRTNPSLAGTIRQYLRVKAS